VRIAGMNANVPTDICFSFAGLMRRGGATGPHRDGWGIALYEGKGCRTFHDPKQALILKLHDSFGNIRSRVGSSSAI